MILQSDCNILILILGQLKICPSLQGNFPTLTLSSKHYIIPSYAAVHTLEPRAPLGFFIDGENTSSPLSMIRFGINPNLNPNPILICPTESLCTYGIR